MNAELGIHDVGGSYGAFSEFPFLSHLTYLTCKKKVSVQLITAPLREVLPCPCHGYCEGGNYLGTDNAHDPVQEHTDGLSLQAF